MCCDTQGFETGIKLSEYTKAHPNLWSGEPVHIAFQCKQNMMNDPYLNALRTVFGYALTCHKAQGGEWDYVYLDIPKSVPALPKPYVYQWVYTAMTRAKRGLYLVDDFWII